MNVVCEKCSHEFELSEEAAAETGGATKCPSCGEETGIGPVGAGSTLPWHPGQEGVPPPGAEGIPPSPPAEEAPALPEELQPPPPAEEPLPLPEELQPPPPAEEPLPLPEELQPPPPVEEPPPPPPVEEPPPLPEELQPPPPVEEPPPPPVEEPPPPVPAEEPTSDSGDSDNMFDAAEEDSAGQSDTTGKPKERSVLFEIGAVAALGHKQRASARTGGGEPEASGLLDIRMLAHKIHVHEEEHKHEQQVSFVAGSVNPMTPVVLPSRAPALVPVADSSSSKKGLLIAVIAFFVVAVAAVVLLVFIYKGRSDEGGEKQKQVSASMAPMDEAMKPEAMKPEAMKPEAMKPEAMKPEAMKPEAMKPEAMKPEAMKPEAMKPEAMKPEAMKPEPPKKLPRKLRRKHIKPVIAALKDKFAACKKDKKGRFKIRFTVEGKTGKVIKVRISGRKYRKSETGKCLAELFSATPFPQFRRKKQSFTHRVRIK
jgi:pentapeptide MXKDX repeat protein